MRLEVRGPCWPGHENTLREGEMTPGEGNRRERILAAAEKVFQAHGYAAATMDAVAAEAGVAKGSIYNYFESKHDLFAQIFKKMTAGELARADELLAAPATAREKLEALLDYWSGRLEQYKRIGRLVLEFWATAAREDQQGELPAMFRQLYSQSRGMVAAILAEGAKSGEFSRQFDSPVAASLILAMLDGIEVQAILDMGITLDGEFLAAMKRSILAALTAGTGEDQSETKA